MKLTRPILAGVVGVVIVYIIVLFGGELSGRSTDLCYLLGASISARLDGWTWLLGAVGQLVIGIVAALVYAAVFEWVTRRAGVMVGFAVALAHVVVAGIATGFLPAQRLLDAGLDPPGAFLEYRGLFAIMAFVIAHLLFGCIVGVLYGRPRHTVVEWRATWIDVTAR